MVSLPSSVGAIFLHLKVSMLCMNTSVDLILNDDSLAHCIVAFTYDFLVRTNSPPSKLHFPG